MSPDKLVDENDPSTSWHVGCQDISGPGKIHEVIHDPSDLGSLILILVIPKECTHSPLIAHLDLVSEFVLALNF